MKKLFNKKLLIIFGQTLFGLLLLYVWSRFIDFGKLLEYIPGIKVQFLVIALLFAYFGTILRTIRWKILISPIISVPFFQLLLMSFASAFINYLVPIRAGEVSKAWFLKKKYNLDISRSLPSVLLDKGFDFFVLLSLFIILPTIFLSLREVRLVSTWWALIFLAIPLVMVYMLVWKQEFVFSFIKGLKKVLPNFLGEGLEKVFGPFLKGFSVLRREPVLLTSLIILSISAFLADSAWVYFLFLAFGYKSAILPIIFATILVTLSFIIPSAPGYVGTTEVAGSLVFSVVLGIEANFAASVVVFYHLLTALMVFMVGVIALEILHFNLFGLLKKTLGIGNNA
jgi:uncharacterized protein (TIRG00374 family)